MVPVVSGEARTRLGTWLPRLTLLLAGAYFAVMAGRWIASPGLEYDELIFVNAATGEPTNGLFVLRRVLGVPVILMWYIGALKAYLYYPVFQIFGVSPQTVRWPVIVVSLVTLALTYRVARFSVGRLVSAMMVLVMSVDPTFMYLTKLDYQVALMMVLKVTALLFALRAVSTGSPRYLWGMVAACALGVFDKLNFVWFLLALVGAGAMLFRTELREMWRRDRAGLLLPLTTLALIGLATVARSIRLALLMGDKAASVAPLDGLRDVANLYASTMNGRNFYLLVTERTLAAESLMNPIVAIGFAGMVVASLRAARRAGAVGRMPFQDRVLLCHLLIFALIAVQILVTTIASGISYESRRPYGAHHIMMLYPFQLFVAFGAAARLVGIRGTAVVAAVLVASGLNVGAAYERNFRPTAEFRPQWSPVIYRLVDFLNHQPAERIISVDWGIHNQIWALGTSRTRAIARDRWPEFRTLGDQQRTSLRGDFQGARVLAILHGAGADIMPAVRPNFLEWCASLGVVPRLERVFTSPAGTVIFEVYAVDGS